MTTPNRLRERIDCIRMPILEWIDGQPEVVRIALRNIRFVIQRQDIRRRWCRPDYSLALYHLADNMAAPGDVPRETLLTLRDMLTKAQRGEQ